MNVETDITRLYLNVPTKSDNDILIPNRWHYGNLKENKVELGFDSGRTIKGRLMFISEVGSNMYNLCVRDESGVEHEQIFPLSPIELKQLLEALKNDQEETT